MQRKPGPATITNPVPAISSLGEILTVQEVSSLLKVPPSSIYEWTRHRSAQQKTPLPHRKIGKYLRFLRSEVAAWVVGLPQAVNTRKRKYTKRVQA